MTTSKKPPYAGLIDMVRPPRVLSPFSKKVSHRTVEIGFCRLAVGENDDTPIVTSTVEALEPVSDDDRFDHVLERVDKVIDYLIENLDESDLIQLEDE